MTRYNHLSAIAAFIRLTNALGVRVWISKRDLKRYYKRASYAPAPKNLEENLIGNVGTWFLDYQACYGGYIVERVYNEANAVDHPLGGGPFGPARKKTRDFIEAIQFFEAVEYYKKGVN